MIETTAASSVQESFCAGLDWSYYNPSFSLCMRFESQFVKT